MNAITVTLLLCLVALTSAHEEFDAEARLAEYAKNFPPTEADFNQECMVFNGDKPKPEIGPLGAILDPDMLWPGRTLSFAFVRGQHTEDQRNKIRAAAAELTRVNGCVRLVENPNAWDKVIIKKCGNSCSSYVGVQGDDQQMCVADWCANEKGAVMHEFIHALGFHHEHSRPDRDSYIYVNYANIQRRAIRSYRKMTTDQVKMLTPYDYGSIMHYGAYSSNAINGQQPVMIPRQNGAKIGNRVALSALDIAKIQILYGCRRVLDSSYFKDLADVQ